MTHNMIKEKQDISQLIKSLENVMNVSYLNSLNYKEINSLYETINELRRILIAFRKLKKRESEKNDKV